MINLILKNIKFKVIHVSFQSEYLYPLYVSRSQFHQQFRISFFANFLLPKKLPTQIVSTEMLYEIVLYKNAVYKMLVKLTLGSMITWPKQHCCSDFFKGRRGLPLSSNYNSNNLENRKNNLLRSIEVSSPLFAINWICFWGIFFGNDLDFERLRWIIGIIYREHWSSAFSRVIKIKLAVIRYSVELESRIWDV